MSIYRFTASPSTHSVEELAIALRDGRDPVAVGAGEHDGNAFVFVDYEMDEVTARQWYAVLPVGMRRVA
jgi:hypothetical protein